MSFLNKYFWMPGETGYTDGEMSYDNSSRTEPKRAQQWLMDSPEPELFCKKKQAVEVAKNRPMSGYANADISLWNSSQFQSGSGLFTDRLFGPELVRASNLSGIKISSVVGAGDSNMERMGFEDQVNANQIKYSDKGIPVSMGLSYCSGDNYTNLFSTTNGDNISSGPTCDYFVGTTFDKVKGSFTLMGQTINKGDDSMFMGHGHSREDSSILSTRRPSLNGNGNFVLADHQYVSGDDNIISRPPAYNKGHESLFAMGTSTANNKANDKFISMGQNFDKGNDNIIPIGPTHDTREYNLIPLGPTPNRVNSSLVLMGTAYKKGQSYKMGENCTAISFGESGTEANNRSLEHNADPNVTVAPAATLNTDANGKKKEKKKNKKNPSNNFPTNVKRLLATGILDGVPVKYTSWARDKSLRGIIKEGAYNCGCNDCKFSQTLNAYEFERHAGCKTKHPNNHIYFQNGKSVYAVVLELQNTTKEMLFEAIQSVTGSPINQKNFSTWKASYEAATRELERIYGKDGVVTRS